MTDDDAVVRRNPTVAYETSDVSINGVVISIAGILAGTLTIVLLLWFLLAYFRSQHGRIADVFGYPAQFAGMTSHPVLQQSPTEDWTTLKEKQLQRLHSYSWIDRKSGIVSIPIEQAMEHVAGSGLPPAVTVPKLELGIPRTGYRQSGLDRLTISAGEAR